MIWWVFFSDAKIDTVLVRIRQKCYGRKANEFCEMKLWWGVVVSIWHGDRAIT